MRYCSSTLIIVVIIANLKNRFMLNYLLIKCSKIESLRSLISNLGIGQIFDSFKLSIYTYRAYSFIRNFVTKVSNEKIIFNSNNSP